MTVPKLFRLVRRFIVPPVLRGKASLSRAFVAEAPLRACLRRPIPECRAGSFGVRRAIREIPSERAAAVIVPSASRSAVLISRVTVASMARWRRPVERGPAVPGLGFRRVVMAIFPEYPGTLTASSGLCVFDRPGYFRPGRSHAAQTDTACDLWGTEVRPPRGHRPTEREARGADPLRGRRHIWPTRRAGGS